MPEKLTKQDGTPADAQDGASGGSASVDSNEALLNSINELKAQNAALAEQVRGLGTAPTRTETPPTETPRNTPTPLIPGEPTDGQVTAWYNQIRDNADAQGLDGTMIANRALAQFEAARAERLRAAAEEKARAHFNSVVARYPNFKDSEASFMSSVRMADPVAIIQNQPLPDGTPLLDVLLNNANGKVHREKYSAGPGRENPPESTPGTTATKTEAAAGKSGGTVIPKTRSKMELEYMERYGVSEEQMQLEDARYEGVEI